ncbi:MAG: hypothetical protein WD768_06310 [Phycisphaeraceae bacterium]
MSRTILTAVALSLFVVAGCKSGWYKPTPTKKWHESIAGTFKGTIGANNDAITIIFARQDGELTATYTIDDPAFAPKPYHGKMTNFTELGKWMLACRFKDDMNAGSFEITFTRTLDALLASYTIDGKAASNDDTVSALKE